MRAGKLQSTGMRTAVTVILMAVLAACSSTKLNGPAPVVERDVNKHNQKSVVPQGYYRVQPGDTLVSIAKQYGTDWHTLVQLNQLSDPNRLEIDQVIRVQSGDAKPATGATVDASHATDSGVVIKPVGSSAPPTTQTVKPEPAPQKQAESSRPAMALKLIWPAQGPIVTRFDGNNNKGVGIGGNLGTAVVAAADGRVVYAGSGLRGYGNLVIIKHDDTFLTAYAHNQALLVKEDQVVKQGQRIAEMGNSESDTVKLHFEVRQLGKPVDPMLYLPKQ